MVKKGVLRDGTSPWGVVLLNQGTEVLVLSPVGCGEEGDEEPEASLRRAESAGGQSRAGER